jgi:signal transduction histidine kinase
MSWVTILLSMVAAVCLTLAGMHLLLWLKLREARENLLFTIAAVAAAATALLELQMMQAQTPADYAEMLRWIHLSVATITVAVVWFVYFYLRAGRRWLAWSITGLRLLILVPNFLLYENATFADISSLRYVMFLGESLSVPIGEVNPWRLLTKLSSLLFLVFVIDAAVSTWKRGQRQPALVLGGATLLAILLSVTFAHLMVKGILPGPFISLNFLLLVLAMAYLLSIDLLRARLLARDLDVSQQRMRLAARAANLGLWEWDIVQDRVWASDTGPASMIIVDSPHMTIERYFELIHADDREATRDALEQALEGNGQLQTELRLEAPGETMQWLSVRGQVERDIDGKPELLRGVSMDITERKQAETELQHHRRDLAHATRVSAMGQLSAALAHEINQPLGAILRNAEAAELFLRQTPPDVEELADILKDIRNDEQRAVAVIERMRVLLKRRELRLEALSVNTLLSEVAKLLHSEIQARTASLRIDIAAGLPQVNGDRVHLQQVFLNLLLNSLDAMNGKSTEQRQIVIRASQTNDGMIEFAVVDRGTGIAPEQLPHLFEPFYTTRENGTGIGLAISKTIVDMHGGRIMAKNNPHGGATVSFILKAVQHEQGPI